MDRQALHFINAVFSYGCVGNLTAVRIRAARAAAHIAHCLYVLRGEPGGLRRHHSSAHHRAYLAAYDMHGNLCTAAGMMKNEMGSRADTEAPPSP